MFQKGAIHISQSTVMGEGESAILSHNYSGKKGGGVKLQKEGLNPELTHFILAQKLETYFPAN